MAALKARFPDVSFHYVASFGNGGTSPLGLFPKDQRYVAAYGRFTRQAVDGTTQPLDIIKQSYDLLRDSNYPLPTYMLGMSAGCSVSNGYTLAQETDTLRGLVLAEPAGIVKRNLLAFAAGMLIVENVINGKENSRLGEVLDPLTLGDWEKATAKAIYEEHVTEDFVNQLETHKTPSLKRVGNLWAMLNGLRRGQTGNTFSPFGSDLESALAKQTTMSTRIIAAEHDPMYGNWNVREIGRALLQTLDITPKSVGEDPSLEFISLPGMSHAYHTAMPTLFHSLIAPVILK